MGKISIENIVSSFKTKKEAQKSPLRFSYREPVNITNALAFVLGEADYNSFIDYVNTETNLYKQEVTN